MNKQLTFATSVLTISAILAGCGGTASTPSAPTAPAPAATAPATPEIIRGGLRFVAGYRAGLEVAAARKQPMLLFFTTASCYWCDQLAADAFTDASVVNLSKQFVCVLIDAEQEPAAVQQFGVRAYPTIQFVSSRGQPLNRMVGKRPGQELVRQMHAALQGLARAGADGTSTH